MLFIILVGASLIMGSCGSDRLSKREYIERVNRINRTMGSTQQQLRKSTGAAPAKRSEALASAADQVDTVVQEVQRLRPPREWEDEHRDLISGARMIRDGLRQLAEAPVSNRPKQVAALRLVTDGSDRVQKATARINDSRP